MQNGGTEYQGFSIFQEKENMVDTPGCVIPNIAASEPKGFKLLHQPHCDFSLDKLTSLKDGILSVSSSCIVETKKVDVHNTAMCSFTKCNALQRTQAAWNSTPVKLNWNSRLLKLVKTYNICVI